MANSLCPCGGPDKCVRNGLCRKCRHAADRVAAPASAVDQLAADRTIVKLKNDLSELRGRYDVSLATIERLTEQVGIVEEMKARVETFDIVPHMGSGTSEATAVMVASDWHIEEKVDPNVVSGLNEYNLDVAQKRTTKFFKSGLRLVRLLQQDVRIDNLVLALLGDFISGDIHEEVAEVCQLPPTEAIILAQNTIISGIDFLLNNSNVTLTVPCHSGNHGRTTRTTRFATENGHSLEYLLFCLIASHYRHEPRVKMQIATGMHSYLDIYGKTLRFHHGHAVKYNGGVGGIYIPVNKAIAQWDKGRRADLDVFGHFHQHIPAPKFVCNGSLIGYNSFALSIKADYEPPQQSLFLMDKKRGRTCSWPILFY